MPRGAVSSFITLTPSLEKATAYSCMLCHKHRRSASSCLYSYQECAVSCEKHCCYFTSAGGTAGSLSPLLCLHLKKKFVYSPGWRVMSVNLLEKFRPQQILPANTALLHRPAFCYYPLHLASKYSQSLSSVLRRMDRRIVYQE